MCKASALPLNFVPNMLMIFFNLSNEQSSSGIFRIIVGKREVLVNLSFISGKKPFPHSLELFVFILYSLCIKQNEFRHIILLSVMLYMCVYIYIYIYISINSYTTFILFFSELLDL
jgi:hypothetical protein